MGEVALVATAAPPRPAMRPALFVIIAGAILVGSAYFFPQSTASGSPLIALLFNVSNQCKSLDPAVLTNCHYQSYWESTWLLLPIFLSCCIFACAVIQINTHKQPWLAPTLIALIIASILNSGYLLGFNAQSFIMVLVIGSNTPNFLLVLGNVALLVGGAMFLAKTLHPSAASSTSSSATYTPQLNSAVFGVLGSGLALFGFFFIPWIKFSSGTAGFANGWITLVHAATSSVAVAILDAIFLPGMLCVALILSVVAVFVKPHPLLTGGYCAAVAISVFGALQFFLIIFFATLFDGCFTGCPNPPPVITPFVMFFVAAMLVLLVSAFLMMQQTPRTRVTSVWLSGSLFVIIGSLLILISSFLPVNAQSSAWGTTIHILMTRGIFAFLGATFGFWLTLAVCVSGISAVLRGPNRWTTSIALISTAVFILPPSVPFIQSFLDVIRATITVPVGNAVSEIIVHIASAIWLAGAIATVFQHETPQQRDISPPASAGRASSFIALGGVLLGSLLTLPWFLAPTASHGESYWQLLQQVTDSSFSSMLNASYLLIVAMPLLITAGVIILASVGCFVRQPFIGILLLSLTLLLLFFLYWTYDISSISYTFFAIGNATGLFFRVGVMIEVIAAMVWLQRLSMPKMVQPSEERPLVETESTLEQLVQ